MKGTSPPRTVGRWSVRKRLRWTVVLTALLLAPVVLVGLALFWPANLPDLRLVLQIEKGMTEAEVAAVFGTQPTDQPWQVAGWGS